MQRSETTVDRVGGYRVVRRLATGGTSDVLLAKAEGPLGFERTVVLKLLLSQYQNDEDFTRMFAREASAYARLSHPSIVRLFDFFALDGQLVMVLEFVDGPSLQRLRGMLRSVRQQLDDGAAMYVAMRIFDALASAHAASDGGTAAPVIHRDVNPSNVLVPWDGDVKLADFGVAKVTGLNHDSVAGMIKGTFGYMAPEQVTGEAVTPQADVYAAGVILWELLARRRAFHRGALPEIEVLRSMAEPKIPPLDRLRPDLDRTLLDTLRRALEPRAERRIVTAEEMGAVLRALVSPDEGRERLAAMLALVRHEPKPTPSMPPGEEVEPVAPPGPVAPPAPLNRTAQLPGVKPPPPRFTPGGGLPAVRPPPPKTVSSSSLRAATPLASGSQPRVASATAAYGVSVPRPPPGVPGTRPSSPKVPTTTAKLGGTTPRPRGSEGRIPTPLQTSAHLRDAVEEILRESPAASSIAGDVPTERAVKAPPRTDAANAKDIGNLPPSPPPLTADGSRRSNAETLPEISEHEAPTVVPPPSGVDAEEIEPIPALTAPTALNTTLAMVRPSAPHDASTPPIDFPQLERTLAMGMTAALPPAPAPMQPTTAPMQAVPMPTPVGQQVRASSIPTPNVPLVAPQLSRPSMPAFASSPSMASQAPVSIGPPPPSRRGGGAMIAVIAGLVVLGGVGAAGYVMWQRSQTATPLPVAKSASAEPKVVGSAPALTTAPVAPTARTSASASSSSGARVAADAAAPLANTPEAGASGSEMGVVNTSAAAPHRRIFVDEKVVGQTPEIVQVKCGPHTIRLGSSGKNQSIEVPCGAEISVGDPK